jgi:hypothetical protein
MPLATGWPPDRGAGLRPPPAATIHRKENDMAIAPKEALHQIIDALSDDQAAQLLSEIEDPVLRAVRLAPVDDEPLSPEEEAALDEGLDAARRGDVKSIDDVERELGL